MAKPTAALLREVSPAPHLRRGWTTPALMWLTVLCLMPAWSWGLWLYGWKGAAWPVLFCILSALVAEGLVNIIQKKFSLDDGSALLSGLLLGLTLPPEAPFYLCILGAFFAIWVVKWSFGGLGGNWINPALAARAMLFFSFPQPMLQQWPLPRVLPLPDALSSATPLLLAREGFGQALPQAPVSLLGGLSYSDLLLGRVHGSIGESSALLLLLGGTALLALRVISWHIPLGYLLAVALGSWALGGLPYQQGWFQGDPWFHLLSGGVALAAFFMATDPASSPLHRSGMLLYAALAGLLTSFFRVYASYPEGVMFAILLANCFAPLIDRLIADPVYGSHPAVKKSSPSSGSSQLPPGTPK